MNPIIETKNIIETDEDREKSRLFKEELLKFNTLNGRENFKVPQIGGKELDLYRLYKEVVNRGGSTFVSENKQWKEIVNSLELPASCTSASFTLRNHYNRCLHAYESYFTKNPSITPNTNISSSNSAQAHIQHQNNANTHTHLSSNIHAHAQQPTNLPTASQHLNSNSHQANHNTNNTYQPTAKKEEQFLGKKVIRTDTEFNLIFRYQGKPQAASRDKSYQKKVRLLNAVPDMRKIVLAFESHVTSEIVWALNTLMLFSSNSACALQLEYQPYLIESMTNYLYYCINNISDMFYLIDIIEGNTIKTKSENNFNFNFGNNNNNNTNNYLNFGNSSSTNILSGIPAYANNLNPNSLKHEITQLNSAYANNQGQSVNLASNPLGSLANQKDASTRLQNKRAKSFNESTTFHFLEEINKTISLSTISKKQKNLLEIEKKKSENHINLNLEEVSEYELIEHVCCIMQIIRNLSYLKANEAAILKCQKFTNLLYLVFNLSNLQDLKTNCLDIITNISRHISLKEVKFPIDLLQAVFDFLKNPNREVSEQALECLRRLTFPSGNDEFFEKMHDEFFEELINLLLAYKMEIREAAVEILYFLSDLKLPTKTRLGKQPKCVQRLVAIVCANSAESKISKWAVCTLAKLAEVPSILKIITCYEQELFFAACTDESISRIIMGILSNS